MRVLHGSRPGGARRLLAVVMAGCVATGGCAADGEHDSGGTGASPDQNREEELSDYARVLGIDDPPAVEVVREVSPEDQVGALRECMGESGFAVSDPQSTSLEWDVPQGQDEAFSLAIYVCNARYPIAQEHRAPLDADGRGGLYDHWVSETIPCLQSLGYSVEVPPSRDSFMAGAMWDPRASTMEQVMADVSEGRWASEDSVYGQECPTEPG